MSHYKSNLRDVEFNLFELFDRQDILGTGPFDEVDVDTAKSILERGRAHLPRGPRSIVRGRRPQPAGLRPATQDRDENPAFAKTYKAWMDAEWWRLQIPEELGGQIAPASLMWAMREFVLGANPAIWMYCVRSRVRAHRVRERQRARQEASRSS